MKISKLKRAYNDVNMRRLLRETTDMKAERSGKYLYKRDSGNRWGCSCHNKYYEGSHRSY